MRFRCYRTLSRLVTCAVAMVLIIAIPTNAQDQTKSNKDKRRATRLDRKVTMMVAKYLERNHYTMQAIDDDISKQLFVEYFGDLDHNRYYFLQSDIDEFTVYRDTLDDGLKKGDLDFAFKVYERFIERARERVAYVKEIIDDQYDYTIDEEIILEREDLPWPKTTEELDVAWRQRVKNQLLMMHLLAEEEAKDAAENDGTADEAEPDEEPETPEQQVLKRYEQFLKFRDENDNADILEIFVSTMTRILDPHTSYLNWRSLEDFDIAMRLSLQGIGATLRYEDGYTEVVSIIPGGPADEQGELKPRHKIIAVAQGTGVLEDVVNMQLNKVVRKIRGDKGTDVRLQVIKSLHGMPKTIKITRGQVKLTEQEAKGEVFDADLPDGSTIKIGVVDVPSFYADFDAIKRGDPAAKSTTVDVRKIIDAMIENDKISGVIIDLRSNGGGSLEEAISLSGLFIPSGPVVQVRKVGGHVDVRSDEDDGFAYKLPLAVVVNQLSASASEIFSGAIQDYSRGLIIGSKGTHGKGTVQTVLKLERMRAFRNQKPGALKYTMAKFYRVTGASTQKRGITPDVIFPSFLDHMELGEAQLDHVLPWDTIGAPEINRNFVRVTPYMSQIASRSSARLAGNEQYQQLVADIAEFGRRKENKTVTLHKEKRMKQREEEEYWAKRSQAILGGEKDKEEDEEENEDANENELENPDEQEVKTIDDAEEAFPDLYLDESLYMMSDLIDLLTRDNKLASRLVIDPKDLKE
jgi:carboxyl-terminal processing protease